MAAFSQLSPRGRVLMHPRAGALPETMALARLWRGGDERLRSSGLGGGGERLRRRFSWPVEFAILLEICGSNFYRLAICAGRTHSISLQVRMSKVTNL